MISSEPDAADDARRVEAVHLADGGAQAGVVGVRVEVQARRGVAERLHRLRRRAERVLVRAELQHARRARAASPRRPGRGRCRGCPAAGGSSGAARTWRPRSRVARLYPAARAVGRRRSPAAPGSGPARSVYGRVTHVQFQRIYLNLNGLHLLNYCPLTQVEEPASPSAGLVGVASQPQSRCRSPAAASDSGDEHADGDGISHPLSSRDRTIASSPRRPRQRRPEFCCSPPLTAGDRRGYAGRRRSRQARSVHLERRRPDAGCTLEPPAGTCPRGGARGLCAAAERQRGERGPGDDRADRRSFGTVTSARNVVVSAAARAASRPGRCSAASPAPRSATRSAAAPVRTSPPWSAAPPASWPASRPAARRRAPTRSSRTRPARQRHRASRSIQTEPAFAVGQRVRVITGAARPGSRRPDRRQKKLCGSTSIATRTLPGQGTAADPGAQRRLQRHALRRAHQQPQAVAAADAGDRRRRRAEQLGAGGRQRPGAARQRAGDLPGARLVGAADHDPGEPAVGRHRRPAAGLGLGAPEALVVAREDRADRRMLGLVGLHQREARPLGAAGAAGDLADQLEGLLGGAQVAALQPEVGVDHPDEGQQREVVALGDELGADDEVGAATGDLLDARLQRARPVGEVGGEDREAGVGPERAPPPRPAARRRGRARSSAPRPCRPGRRSGSAWSRRTGGRPAACGSGARPSARRTGRSRPGGRRRGRWSAARSRGG